MENIFIAERQEIQTAPSGTDKIISVFYQSEVDYFYDFFDAEQYETLYYDLDDAIDRFLLENKTEKAFLYRDISLLQCFRLSLFLHLLNVEILQRTFRCLATSRPHAFFHIEEHGFNSYASYLSQIVPGACPDLFSRVVTIPAQTAKSRTSPSVKSLFKNLLWPSRVHKWGVQNPQVLVYSDYYRTSAVMKRLGITNCVYYTCFPEPKLFFTSVRDGFAYVQNVFSESKKTAGETFAPTIDRPLVSETAFSKFHHLRSIAEEALNSFFKTELPALLFQIDCAHELFPKKPSLQSVLLDEDLSPHKNALCQVAQKFNKKCYVEAHGALGDKYGYLPLTADHMFVWGKAQKNKLVQWGCPPDRLIVAGCSKYAAYQTKNDRAIREQFCKTNGFTSERRIVSFFPFPSLDPRLFSNKILHDRIESILKILETEDIQLCIKLHPGEVHKGFYYSWAKKNSAKIKIAVIQKADPLLLVKASDFLIVHDSTIAVDGFAMGKPVIFFPVFPEPIYSNSSVSELYKYGVFYCPNNDEEFRKTLKVLIKNPQIPTMEPNWNRMRLDCLNEGGPLPEEIMSRHLLRQIPYEEVSR
ncbi:MAG: hypothetical protein A3C35_02510 [Omnitrophica bacterium RIFCSPHIGHO2_02_FULL_46_11]|nr:MAG: hypothetical protein A3C35_02510 [Omnitrophica bacterium RIFCSPHIGHO2_02_FULL_46_11]OGW85586.1 MAG: hypothetical protein A3A81_01225 [Omnitrophica bacterium RIFCSPLOWO2_01_FULL_45_10b]